MRKELADPNHTDNVLELVDVEIAWAQKHNKQFEIITYKQTDNDDMSGKFNFNKVANFEAELADLQQRLMFPNGRPILYVVPSS